MTLLRDLLMGIGNRHWDLGRIVSGLSVLTLIAGAGWNAYLRQPIDLGPSGLGGGLAGILAAAAALIALKDRARSSSGGNEP